FSLCRVDWSFVVFDEAQFMKNPNTLAARAAKALKAHFKLIVTGTPVENSLKDFWSLMDTAKPGHLGAYQTFRGKYIKPITSASTSTEKSDLRQEIGKKLRQDVGKLMLRRVKEDELDGLPEKIVYTGVENSPDGAQYLDGLHCLMSHEQEIVYGNVIDFVNESQELGATLSGLHKLRDVSLHPCLLDGGILNVPQTSDEAWKIVSSSGKLKKTFMLLEEINQRQEKVIIFMVNKRLQSFVSVACQHIFNVEVPIVNGDTKTISKNKSSETRKSLIEKFENNIGFGIIVMSPIAAGTGLTVTAANNVIHLERHWNPAKEAQATDRVYRIGQEKNVNVYFPILCHKNPDINTFDINLNRLIGQKSSLKDAVIIPEEVSPEELSGGLFQKTNYKSEISYSISGEDLPALGWERFEAFCAELLAKVYSCEAILTKQGGDKGADIVLKGEKNNILVQCKHVMNPKNQISSEMAVREIYAAQRPYEDALEISFGKLIVISNVKSFSKQVRKSAKSYQVDLMDSKFIEKQLRLNPITHKDLLFRYGSQRLEI
ncbi:MAG: SNF2-related protein, partial [Pseudomonadota bacterium]|nr:SNF2-related protein [Pseudomonadota bacterium]